MGTRVSGRRARLAQARQARQRPASQDAFFSGLCRDIHSGRLIPIIGDTIRNGHIFDIDFDRNLGVDCGPDGDEADDTDELLAAADEELAADEFNVTEELALAWADEVGYPLADGYQMARVAQYWVLKTGDHKRAKQDYLDFCKRYLLGLIAVMPEVQEDVEERALVQQLQMEHTLTFADIVDEMDFPRFPDDKQDPLRILARLPLKIYLTTGYYDFVERELIAAGKHPRSRLCFWNMGAESVLPEHRPDPDYIPDPANPVVYHLFGIEQYPDSLVLSEDDYLNFLAKLARDDPSDQARGIIPAYLESELKGSALLLLGYRLQDWDFRTLFHGLLKGESELVLRDRLSVAIQLEPEEQPLVIDEQKAREYLDSYFKGAKFQIRWGDSDEFIARVWTEWQRWSQGGAL